MLFYTSDILTWPLGLTVCALDTWLVFALFLLAARHLAGDRWNIRNSLLHAIVEGPVQVTQRRLAQWRDRAWPAWASWAVTFGVVITMRQALTVLLSAMS